MPDYIPSADDPFNHFITALGAYLATNAASLNVTPEQAAAFADALAVWTPAWNAWQAEQVHYKALLDAKDQARALIEPLARQINAAAQAGPNVTDESRINAGLPVHKTGHSPMPTPVTRPVLVRVEKESMVHRLWFADEITGSKAKPRGVASCEFRQQIVAAGGAAPNNQNAMPFLANDTKSPHRTDFEPEDVGKTAYYAQRWVGSRGEPGPWGAITGYPII